MPEKWNLSVVCSIAALLGGVTCGGSMLMFYMCLSTTDSGSFLAKYSNVENLTYTQIQCALHLKGSSYHRFPHRWLRPKHTGSSSQLLLLGHALQFPQRTSPRFSPGALIGIIWFIIQDDAYAAVNHTKVSLGGESAKTKDRKKKLVFLRAQK